MNLADYIARVTIPGVAGSTVQASDVYPHASFMRSDVATLAESANGAHESGLRGAAVKTAPALFWLVLVGVLIVVRVIWEISEGGKD